MNLALPVLLQDRIAREALAAFPRECCGLIEGVKEGDTLRAVALHPGRNLAAAADRFELDSVGHIAAMKSARAAGHILIGCYHSHPDGKPEPSPRDLGGAAEADFLWLIAATDGASSNIAAWLYRAGGFTPLALSEAVGADLVTSSLNERS
jgi:proteasome lid subunit RPN8/RPN11